MIMRRLAGEPALILLLVLAAVSVLAVALGVQITRVTEIAIYTLYGAGVNLLIGYTGLVPFGASVFFGLGDLCRGDHGTAGSAARSSWASSVRARDLCWCWGWCSAPSCCGGAGCISPC